MMINSAWRLHSKQVFQFDTQSYTCNGIALVCSIHVCTMHTIRTHKQHIFQFDCAHALLCVSFLAFIAIQLFINRFIAVEHFIQP